MANNDRLGKKKIKFLEQVNEIELVAGIVGIAVALVYQGVFAAIAVAIGVVFLESIILVEISNAKNVTKIRQQSERIEAYLKALHNQLAEKSDADISSIIGGSEVMDEEKKDPYKWHKIIAWSAVFIAITFLVNHFLAP